MYLNVVPLPNGNKLSENATYYVTCKNASIFFFYVELVHVTNQLSYITLFVYIVWSEQCRGRGSWDSSSASESLHKMNNFLFHFQYGETFVNKVYSVEGITEEAVYKTGAIEVKCQYNGTIYPPFFNETYNWCRSKFISVVWVVHW